MIQIRNVPDEIHRALKIRAMSKGLTLSEYLLREVTLVANRPELEDLLRHFQDRESSRLSETPAQAIRAERESRP